MLRYALALLLLAAPSAAFAGDAVKVVVPDFAIRVQVPNLIPNRMHLTGRLTPRQTTIQAAPVQSAPKAAPQQKATPRQRASKLTPSQTRTKAAPMQTAAKTRIAPTQKGFVQDEPCPLPGRIARTVARRIAMCVVGRRLSEAPPAPIP